MNRDERKQMREEWRKQRRMDIDQGGGRVGAGLLLLAVGGLLLARQVGANIPGWMFHWPMILIAVGLYISFRSGFRNTSGLIIMAVGSAFLLNEIIPNAHMENFIWPGILIIAGIIFIVRPKKYNKKCLRNYGEVEDKWHKNFTGAATVVSDIEAGPVPANGADAEFIEINAVFGSVNKFVLSKNFRGGEINAFMGGAEVSLVQADIKQTVELEINAVFGGAKLILPGNWNVENRITAVFGGVEDKRHVNLSAPDPNKTIILKGACLFGGIEIRSF